MNELAAPPLDARTLDRLYGEANAAQWGVSRDTFARALDRGVRRAFTGALPQPLQLERHFDGLHLKDLTLACACADGHEAAWDHFVREYRPVLFRAASAIDGTGGARDLADSLHAELFGLTTKDGERRSLFAYFHGRSSLATWLRAVLAQRHVDRARRSWRDAPLPDDDSSAALHASAEPPAPDRGRFVALIRVALAAAVARLAPRERLRLACYYGQSLTLAEIGRALGEHEATVSRQLAKTRKVIRQDVERQLREGPGEGPGEGLRESLRAGRGLSEEAVAECFASVAGDPGPLDLADLLEPAVGKNPSPDRSR